MKISSQFSKYAMLGVVLAGLGLAFVGVFDRDKKGVVVDVQVPELSTAALRGKEAFNANCAQCHGKNGSGTGKGPPLIHQIYNPGHHGDQAFLRAAKQGVRRHHWPYGDMPKQPQVTNTELAAIVKYVRELQVANGIT
jgi:mono/diheme cytochrome c family protein